MTPPIKHGYSKGAVGHNIRTVQNMGAPHKEAVAMALKIRDAELRKREYRKHHGMSRMPSW